LPTLPDACIIMSSKMTPQFLAALTQIGQPYQLHEPLAQHTTFRLGGPAQIWLAAQSVTALVQAVQLAREYAVSFFILGGGANLLISDNGFAGLVIQNRTSRVQFPEINAASSSVTLTVDSGVILPNLARRCAKRGLAGLEWAAGVPGTIGGAVVNNAGAYGSDIAHDLLRAELLSPTGERVWQAADWFEYRYRWSRLKGQASHETAWVVLQAELQLACAPVAEIEQRLTDFNSRRKSSQPPGATIGSMFKNPPGDYAGRLIEAVGLKGYRYGQAQISPIHANFFQNLGRATATEVYHLITTAQQAVAQKFNIQLELEVEVIGE